MLAPVAAGTPAAAELAAFSKNPIGYCMANPAGCTLAAEEALYTAGGAVSVNSVVPDIPKSSIAALLDDSSTFKKALLESRDFAIPNRNYPNLRVTDSQTRLPGQVNRELAETGYRAPYSKDSVVVEAKLAIDTQFVRVFTKGKSEPAGKWIMQAADIKGLTAKQIQHKYALPNLPTHISIAKIPKGTKIRAGKVGPNFGFEGGKTQYELIDRVENAFLKVEPLK